MHHLSIAQAFHQTFGTSPTLVVRAPGRINLIGEHTDYNQGLVLPAAIDKSIWLAMGPRADDQLHFHSLDLLDDYQGPVAPIVKSAKNWANYLLGVLHELQRDGISVGGVNLVFGGDIPIGAGLSSSAALESGMLAGLNQLFQLQLQPIELVKLAQRGENLFVGMNCGIMDMFASVMGRCDSVLRLDCRSLEFDYFPFRAPGLSLLLCDSGVKHALVDSEYNARRAECEEGVRLLQAVFPHINSLRDLAPAQLLAQSHRLPDPIFRRCKFVVEEIARVDAACLALKQADLSAFGQLMLATQQGLRHEYEVTCPETDFLADQALPLPGVVGARQMGGGFGGCTLNLVRQEHLPGFTQTMKAAYLLAYGRELPCYEVALVDGVEVRLL